MCIRDRGGGAGLSSELEDMGLSGLMTSSKNIDVYKRQARTLLGWNPTKTSFPELVKIMVSHEMKCVKKLHMKELMNREE